MKHANHDMELRDRENPQKWHGFLFKEIHGDKKVILDHESEATIQNIENWKRQDGLDDERTYIEITEKQLLEAIEEIIDDQQ